MIEELWSGLISLTEPFVVPDWGALVLLIPIGLAVLVFGYIAWLAYRFATAGPKRRGKGRIPPATPSGIHMPGPSFAPVLGAIGASFMVFGMVAGGIWLAVGALILVITLLYWGREALRDYDHIAAAGGGQIAAGALPAPTGTPPEGVHIPPPSFRPLLVSIALFAMVAGMIIGGAALLLGFIAIVITGLGWLWDSRKEYAATVEADRTGHLDLGGPPAWPKATFFALGVIVLGAVLLGTGFLSGTGDGTATASGAPGAGAAPGASAAPGGAAGAPSAAPSAAIAADAVVVAENIAWVETSITVPAGVPFTLALDNRDSGVPHDVVIKDAGGADLFKGEVVTGPAVVVYDVPALPAGQYPFVCSIHPNMTGTITAQ